MANRLANLLRSEGVGPGDIVAVQLPNRRESCAFDYAIAAVGAISLPMPVNYGPKDMQNLLFRSQAIAYVTIDRFHTFDHLAAVTSLRAELPALRTVFALASTGADAEITPSSVGAITLIAS